MTIGKGFHSPNHTQVPNDLFDVHMKEMGEAELKVVLHTIRQTLGFHKGVDAISITQYQKATGLSRPAVIRGLAQAVTRGVLSEKTKGKRGIKSYSLVIKSNQSRKVTSTGNKSLPVYEAGTSNKSLPTKEKKENPQKKGAGTAVSSTTATVGKTRPKIFTFYEQTTGNTLTHYLGETILEACQKYGENVVQDAMAEAARNNARTWSYTEKILERWEREGRYPNTGKIVPIKKNAKPAENEEPDDWGAEHFVREANDVA